MKEKVRMAIVLTAAYALVVWVLEPAGFCWFMGRSSLIRLDPQVSKDYDCIYVEGYSRHSFTVPWLCRHTPLEYLRVSYRPLAESQSCGIMFVDPKTMAFASSPSCTSWPCKLQDRLDSPGLVLEWMRSQPASAQAPSHTNDAHEVYQAIEALAQTDVEHFVLPTGFVLHNYIVGDQAMATHEGPTWHDVPQLLLLWIAAFACSGKKTESESGSAKDTVTGAVPPPTVS